MIVNFLDKFNELQDKNVKETLTKKEEKMLEQLICWYCTLAINNIHLNNKQN